MLMAREVEWVNYVPSGPPKCCSRQRILIISLKSPSRDLNRLEKPFGINPISLVQALFYHCDSKVQRVDHTCDVIRKVAPFVLSKL